MTFYIVQKRINAGTVQEALKKEPEAPVTSVYPDTAPESDHKADAIGFKYVDNRHPYEY